ncbi:mitotic-spindle organizing protein 2A-like [Taeniopygia guttata]|uniref:Putative family with sequence similarity 128 member B variant 2 n=2 Tax=Taeniopygia guttata TaxID=59729 RepID=B5G139_TAEGU|nr:mitotic-spindle organizing protein 2A-like [Taeniopygia guttata]ACH45000.1 putative family with sequence similarity 128 member B variant 2 [Taeniopygia guttata]ACH46441.1 putative family with sequence similarity 128 member B variant 2 [Taeniopygia guttata]
MSEGTAAMAAPAPMAETRLRRKQLLSAEEAELFELAQAAGSGLDPEVFRVLLDLLRMNVAPLAVFQVLKSMCAGQRLPPAAESGPAAPMPADSRGRNKTSSAVGGSQILAERSSREGSAQRMPRQPSASRMQKAGTSGKSSGGGNSA